MDRKRGVGGIAEVARGRGQDEVISIATGNRRRCHAALTATLLGALAVSAPAGAAARSAVRRDHARYSGDPFTGALGTAPWSESAPAILGASMVGGALSVQPGVWTGPTPVGLDFQWYRCGGPCSPIAGATGSTYTASGADAGSYLKVIVNASDGSGSSFAPTLPVGPILGLPPAGPAIAAQLAPQLAPAGDGLNVAVALIGPGLTLPLRVPYAGALQVSWYYQSAPYASPYAANGLIASGSATYLAPGTGAVVIKATAAGRKLLQGRKQVPIAVAASFTVPFAYAPPVIVSSGFALR
jgi:hypothetical protein